MAEAGTTRLVFPSVGLLRRELLSGMRRGRTYAVQAIFVAGGIALAVVGWPEGAYVLTRLASFSREFLNVVALVLFGSCVLFVPAFAANAIALERERRTFDLLQLTLIRPAGMVLGNLLNSVGFFLFLTVAALPVFSVAFFLVGVDLMQMTRVVAIVLMSAVACGLVGIAVSARCKKLFQAVALSYVAVLLLFLVAPCILFVFWVAVWVVVAQVVGGPQMFPGFDAFVQVCSPVATIVATVNGFLIPQAFWLALFSQGAVAAVCFWLATQSLGRVSETPQVETPPKPIDDPDVLQARRRRYPFFLIDPLKPKRPIEDGRNPMLVKELRWGLLTRGTMLVRMTYWAVILFFLLGAGAYLESGSYNSMYAWLMSQIVVTVLVAPALLANAFTKEHEQGNLDALRMTLLTPREIVFGKLLSGALALCPVLVAAVLSALQTALFLGLHQWSLMTTAYGTLLVCCWLCFGSSLLASLFTRRTTMAVVLSYVFGFVALVGVAAVVWLLATYVVTPAGGAAVSVATVRTIERVAGFLSPIFAFMLNASSYRSAGLEASAKIGGYWLANVAVFASVAAVMTGCAVRLFERRYMRDT